MKQAILLVVSHVCVLAPELPLVDAFPALPRYCSHGSRGGKDRKRIDTKRELGARTHETQREGLLFIEEPTLMTTPNHSYTASLPHNCSWASSSNL